MNTSTTSDKAPIPSPDELRRNREERNRLENEIAELSARIDAAIYELLVRIRRFDELGGWSGATSYPQWLSWRANLAPGTAREYVRVAHALADLPKTSDALRRGQISYSKVRAITRVATAATEDRLLHLARQSTAADLERIARAWRLCDRQQEGREDAKRRRNQELSIYPDVDGMFVVRALLTPELGAVVRRAIEAASEQLYQEAKDAEPKNVEKESPACRRGDALGLIAESALAAKLDTGTAGDRYQVVVHVDPETLRDDVSAETSGATDGPSENNSGKGLASAGQAALEEAGGIRVSAETSRRVACDAGKVVMRHDAKGNVLDVGRKTRTVSPALRRAQESRDQHCRFPGCEARRCDAHHVKHWADGGTTKLDNLVLLCRRHHRAVHEEGFGLTLDAEGQPRFTRPNGQLLQTVPAPPSWSGAPLAPMDAKLAEDGIEIDANTSIPNWAGERLDLPYVIGVAWRPGGSPGAEEAAGP
ncbi:MAG: DUF222 domain-containing protein [Acidobacteria bacterium]|nr:DUF222 domain-containing protein [Acidobacteriota bacterium]